MKNEITKIGIIICDRYRSCAGGKCFRALKNREGAFAIYKNKEVEIAGYIGCGGCPGSNIEYAPAEMKKNGITNIHLATGLIVGYPPCPRIKYFKKFISENFGIKVIIGTHPIPEKYYIIHQKLKTWNSGEMQKIIKATLENEEIRIKYN